MGNKKKKVNVVYSTNPNFNFDYESDAERETLDAKEQRLKVFIDRKNRKGKEVTVVSGFIGQEADLKELGKLIKTKCGVGGSVKDGEILIQGSLKNKVFEFLTSMGYQVKMSGG